MDFTQARYFAYQSLFFGEKLVAYVDSIFYVWDSGRKIWVEQRAVDNEEDLLLTMDTTSKLALVIQGIPEISDGNRKMLDVRET